jgi:hypothetical protein
MRGIVSNGFGCVVVHLELLRGVVLRTLTSGDVWAEETELWARVGLS